MYNPLKSIVIILAQNFTLVFLAKLNTFLTIDVSFSISPYEQRQLINDIHYFSDIKRC